VIDTEAQQMRVAQLPLEIDARLLALVQTRLDLAARRTPHSQTTA
jgi:hypothetical protein